MRALAEREHGDAADDGQPDQQAEHGPVATASMRFVLMTRSTYHAEQRDKPMIIAKA